jgi:dipeptidyl aminopeptidase/acylaminoacyl peptidase
MFRKITNLLLCIPLILSFITSANVAASDKISIEDFVKLADAKDMQISPDGKHLSVIFRKNGTELLGILDRKSRKVLSTFGVKGKKRGVGRVRWANNERLIYNITESYSSNKTVFETGELAAVNVDGSKHKLIFGYKAGEKQVGKRRKVIKSAYGSQSIIDMLEDDKENILIAFYPWKESGRFWKYNPDAITTIYKLNIYTGQRIRLESLPTPDSTAITDNNGKLRFAVGENHENQLLVHYRNSDSNKWIRFITHHFEGRKVVPISFTADNNAVYITANVGTGTRALYLFDLKTQSYTQLFHDAAVDISRFVFDFPQKRIVAVGTKLTLPKYHYLDKNNPKAIVHRILQKSFKASDVLITSATDDGMYVVAYVYSDTNPGDYYLYDTNKKKAHYLLPRKSKIFPQQMNSTQFIQITARDGVVLGGYLTLPGVNNTDLPMVVLPHGGPHGVRDEWGYDWEVQLLANRGYAVLQVNYRGSGGFGVAFKKAGQGKWGTLMQDDITDATLELIANGVADKKKNLYFRK